MTLRAITLFLLLFSLFLFFTRTLGTTLPSQAYTPHPRIEIRGNSDFTAANGVTSGSGTESDPYIIRDWNITGFGGPGIAILNTTAHFVISHVSLSDPGDLGISLSKGSNGVIQNVVTQATLVSIRLEAFNHAIIAGSHMSSTDDGIVLIGSTGVTITGNAVTDSSGQAEPWLDYFGIQVVYSQNVLIADNYVENLATGIHIINSLNTTLSGNSLNYNYNGVGIQNSNETIIYHNRFLNNHVQAEDLNQTAKWDDGYPLGGNYWSNYNGTDNCSGILQNICPRPDGIGDTPYTFPTGIDHYPLVESSILPPKSLWTLLQESWIAAPIALLASLSTYMIMRRRKSPSTRL